MYKDKDRQREADRARQKRRRDKIKAEGVTDTGRDSQGVTDEESDAVLRMVLGVQKNNRVTPKRGKDIKYFTDLPLDVQQTIERLCPDVVGDYHERCRRTAIAIDYQHKHPDRYYSTGVGAEISWERYGQETIKQEGRGAAS